MATPNRDRDIKVVWEHVDDPNAADLLRRVVLLILRDSQESRRDYPIDKPPLLRLNEEAPAESTNQSQPNG